MVAEAFGKRHDNVMASIKTIMSYLENNKLDALNFKVISYRDSMNREKPCYEMYRNAWSQLVGSFDGEKATIFRKKYADAFDAMENALIEQNKPKQISHVEVLALAETVISQNKEIEIMKPKVEVIKSFLHSPFCFFKMH